MRCFGFNDFSGYLADGEMECKKYAPMKINNAYISTKEAMETFGLNRVWLFRKFAKIRRIEKIERGRNKVYYNVSDIRNEILKHDYKTPAANPTESRSAET